MDNQKDNKKTNIYNSNVSNYKPLLNKPISPILNNNISESFLSNRKVPLSNFANKKTEKLVTALYMVSDCMETDDALKNKIRLLSVELLSYVYKLSTLSPQDKYDYISNILIHISEILSFIDIAYTVGFISEMNTMILKNEFNLLSVNLKSNQGRDTHFTFNLNQEMFNLSEEDNDQKQDFNEEKYIKDIIKDKRTDYNTMSFINKKSPLSSNKSFKPISSGLNERNNRVNKIMELIKKQSLGNNKEEGVSIKDISLSFSNYSQKTILRDLNNLVSKGQLKKIGAKRWSRYSVAESSR